ncbi:Mitochondrial glycine transporter [Halotydeus destructor]|nr:Mitochondrial glycine transporter [Halotydeus destructor]
MDSFLEENDTPSQVDTSSCLLINASGKEQSEMASLSIGHSPLKQRFDDILTNHPNAKSLIAGSISGTCSTVLLQPFDLVKTRIQTAHISLNSPLRMLPVMTDVVRTDNVIGLWRGTFPSLVRTVPGVAIYFTSLNYLKTNWKGSGKPSAFEAVFMGITARTFAGVLLLPATVLKTRYESGLFNYNSLSQALRVTYATEGLRGLFSGITPTLLRDAPYSGIYFMFYSQLKGLIPETSTTSNSSSKPFSTFLCGLAAGLLASLSTHPFDVVKTKMQLERRTYKNFVTAVMLIHSQKGFEGFLVGLAPRMIRRSLMSALAWTVYESLMKNVGLS